MIQRSKNDEIITLRIPMQMRTEIEQIAVDNHCSMASVVRYAVSNLMKDE